MLIMINGSLSSKVSLQLLPAYIAIIWMQAAFPFIEQISHILRPVPQHGDPLRRIKDPVFFDIPVPDSDARSFQGKLPARLVFFEILMPILLQGNIAYDSKYPGPPVLLWKRPAFRRNPEHRAISFLQAEIKVILCFLRICGIQKMLLQGCKVLRMDIDKEICKSILKSAVWQAKHPFCDRRNVRSNAASFAICFILPQNIWNVLYQSIKLNYVIRCILGMAWKRLHGRHVSFIAACSSNIPGANIDGFDILCARINHILVMYSTCLCYLVIKLCIIMI